MSKRTARRGAVVLAVLLAAAVPVVRRVYVTPRLDAPLRPADAVVVLGGTAYERFHHGIELAASGLAPQVVLSNSVGAQDPVMREMCAAPGPVRVTCFLPEPWTTRGEAWEIRRLAAERGWRSVILVTTTAHIERARYIVGRCFHGDIQMTDYPESRSVGQSLYGWAYQTAGWVVALDQDGC